MKPNSCLYRAVKRVVEYQFGINDLSSEVFDSYNTGDGVPTYKMTTVIDKALYKYDVKVSAVYGLVSDPEIFDRPDLLKKPNNFIPAPCIAYFDQHAEGVLPTDTITATLAIVLERKA